MIRRRTAAIYLLAGLIYLWGHSAPGHTQDAPLAHEGN